MENEALKRIIRRNIDFYEKGLFSVDSVEYLDMIIAAHELKNRNDQEADELIGKLMEFMKETDSQTPLHYSLWLALYPLVSDSLSGFLHHCDMQAVQEDYDPHTGVSGMFHDRFETKLSLPLSAHSELIREEVEECLSKKDHVSAAVTKWMAYEDETMRIRNSFDLADVVSVYYAYTAAVLNMDAFAHAKAGLKCILKIQKEKDLYEIPLMIMHVYDEEITALSFAKPLHLYRIFRNESRAVCYRLSNQEFHGFHVGMFIVDEAQIHEKTICARLIDPAGRRHDVSGTIIRELSGPAYDAEVMFEDGRKRKTEFILSQRRFALIELSDGYADFLKNYK